MRALQGRDGGRRWGSGHLGRCGHRRRDGDIVGQRSITVIGRGRQIVCDAPLVINDEFEVVGPGEQRDISGPVAGGRAGRRWLAGDIGGDVNILEIHGLPSLPVVVPRTCENDGPAPAMPDDLDGYRLGIGRVFFSLDEGERESAVDDLGDEPRSGEFLADRGGVLDP